LRKLIAFKREFFHKNDFDYFPTVLITWENNVL
jgi:hypothetical protein